MSVTNPFSITYGSREVGGSTAYQLHGPYAIDKSHEQLRIAFDVVVTTASYAALKTACDNLETDFRKRDQDITISLDGNDWDYVRGENVLSTSAAISKLADPDTDRGYSRAYTCVIEAGLPASNDSGLRDVSVVVTTDASSKRMVTMSGTYTAYGASGSGTNAYALYAANFDALASTYLTFIDSGATWELVDESYDLDRNQDSGSIFPHVCNFQRQYSELIYNQVSGTLDSTLIKDHRVTFSDSAQHPGDSKTDVHRLRRVSGVYESAIDQDQTTDLASVYENQVKPHLIAIFVANFSPQSYGVESMSAGYDYSGNRISVNFTFVYQSPNASSLVEVSQALTYRETVVKDYTPVHDGGVFSMFVDDGWIIREREFSRTAVYVGEGGPSTRARSSRSIHGGFVTDGWKGPGDGYGGVGDGRLNSNYERLVERIFGFGGGFGGSAYDPDRSGGDFNLPAPGDSGGSWHLVSNVSSSTPQYIGDPSFGQQIKLNVVNEVVVERYAETPKVRSAGSVS